MQRGFTLIELSIVLVIIGLIVGGVLVGRDLIAASAIRAQVSQVDKYQQAVNAFKGKYGYLPGDIPSAEASKFGFVSHGPYAGEGNGDGVIEGYIDTADAPYNATGLYVSCGEAGLFWVDMSTAKLINGNFTQATKTAANCSSMATGTTIGRYFPSAVIGRNSYIYVWSGGYAVTAGGESDGLNYFGLSAVTEPNQYWGVDVSLTVREAYLIDQKIDDGLPQAGNVLALYANNNAHDTITGQWSSWAASGNKDVLGGQFAGGAADSVTGGPVSAANGISVPAGSNTCYDNAGTAGATTRYSITVNNGNNINCALSFKFQ